MNKALKPISIKGSIVINKDSNSVFNYLSDYSKDKFWRKPINDSTLSTPAIQKNTVIIESCFLSRKVPAYISTFICTEFEPNKLVVSETRKEDLFWSKNTRRVESLTPNSTIVFYEYEVDTAIVKHGLGFRLPTFLIRFYTQMEMRMYLAKLKRVLEN